MTEKRDRVEVRRYGGQVEHYEVAMEEKPSIYDPWVFARKTLTPRAYTVRTRVRGIDVEFDVESYVHQSERPLGRGSRLVSRGGYSLRWSAEGYVTVGGKRVRVSTGYSRETRRGAISGWIESARATMEEAA